MCTSNVAFISIHVYLKYNICKHIFKYIIWYISVADLHENIYINKH